MIEFIHSGVLYVFDPKEIVKHLPSEILATALQRGKAYRRHRIQAEREAVGTEARAVRRDRLLSEGI